jgi:signal transduction histidine kinase
VHDHDESVCVSRTETTLMECMTMSCSSQTQAVRRRLASEQVDEIADLIAVEASAREAMAEMRRLFGVLRSDGEVPALTPQPGLDQVDRLLDSGCGPGLDVRLDRVGRPRPLPPGLDLAAYRIIQEALTNVRKHARGASTVRVEIGYVPSEITVTVRDDGSGPAGCCGIGHGLLGMRKRIGLYGGTVHAGPAEDGGFVVAARLRLGRQFLNSG